MDYKESYEELLRRYKQLEEELDIFHQSTHGKEYNDLYEQETFFEQFAEMFPEMIYEVDMTGKVLYANNQCLTFFGYTKVDLKRGINIAELFPGKNRDIIENLNTLKLPGETSSREFRVRKRNGIYVPIVAHSFAKFYMGKIIGHRGVITDISKQKEYENHLIREKAFLEHLYNSTPAAIAIIEPEGTISMINREFTNLFGFTPEEVINKNINDLIIPDNLKAEARSIDRLASINRKELRQTIRKDKYGNKIYVSLTATSIVINDEIVAKMGIYRDITSEVKNQLVKEIVFNISTAALKQYDMKDIYPIIVSEVSKIVGNKNFFIALYDKTIPNTLITIFFRRKG